MAEHVLVASDRYDGKYVALRSFEDNEVIAFGESPAEVLEAARACGADDPVLFFVPEHEMTFVY